MLIKQIKPLLFLSLKCCNYNMKKEQNIITEFFQTVEKIGFERTINGMSNYFKVLQNNNADSIFLEDIIMNCVCQEYRLTKYQLINSNSMNDSRIDALRCVSKLYATELKYSLSTISAKLNKNPSSISRYIKDTKNLSDKVFTDVKMKDTINKCMELLKQK